MSFAEAFQLFFTERLAASYFIEILTFAFGAVSLTGSFKPNKKSVLTHVVYFIILYAVIFMMLAIGSAVAESTGSERWVGSLIIALFALLPGCVFLSIIAKGNAWHRVLKVTYYLSICYLFTEVAHNFNVLVVPDYNASRQPLNAFLLCLPYLPLIPISIWTGRLKTHHVQRLRANLTILSGLLFLSTLIIVFVSSLTDTDETDFRGWLLLAMLLLAFVDMYSYASHYYINKAERTILELEASAQLNQAASIMLELNEASISRTTRARHDLKNTFAYLRELVVSGRTEEALAFIDEAAGSAYGEMQIVDCGNKVVSSIMNLELRKAKLKSVDVKYRLIVPQELGICDNDLCSLMTNIIDNAIEGTLNSGAEKGYVDFSIVARESLLRIQCKNPTSLKAIPTFSTKKVEGHGYGTLIIKHIVKKHQGYSEASIENGQFVLDCLLTLNPKEETNA